MIGSSIWGALALTSFGVNIWQFVVACFTPVHRRPASAAHTPGVTILKPLKGRDGRSRQCLRSWFTLRYLGPIQLLFGVKDADDPIVEIIRELKVEFPEVDAQVVVCPESLGPNAKVSTLMQLEPLIKYALVVVSDADVQVPYDYLTAATWWFRESDVGLVSNLYCLANPSTFAMYWEATVVNSDFWCQVMQARQLGQVKFALGAVMMVRREMLERIGGFSSIVEYLADDYQLGRRISQLPARVEISPLVVECWEGRGSWSHVWGHQLRWARTIRVCQPIPYFFSIITAVSWWAMLWLFIGDGSPLMVAAILGLRVLMATIQSFRLKSYKNRYNPVLIGLMAPLKDILSTVIWLLAFGGGKVKWRGRTFRVGSNGRMVAI